MESTRLNNMGWEARVSLLEGLAIAYNDFLDRSASDEK
jgi:hypothetical protein